MYDKCAIKTGPVHGLSMDHHAAALTASETKTIVISWSDYRRSLAYFPVPSQIECYQLRVFRKLNVADKPLLDFSVH